VGVLSEGQLPGRPGNADRSSKEHRIFPESARRDPAYALAYAGLSRAYISFPPSSDFPPTECFQKAKAAANKALEIDDRLAEGHSVLGAILFWYEWDWIGSEQQSRRAIALDANSADAHYTYAHLLSNTGRHAEALVEMKRARDLDPINLRITALEAQFLLHAGQTEVALNKLRKTVELSPKFWLGHLVLSSVFIEKGMYTEAVREADLAKESSGASNHPLAFKGYALAKAGKKAEAHLVLDELSRQSSERFVPPYYFALVYNGLGETEKAISWLERGFDQRDSKMVFLKVEPKWDNLRSNPRFINLLRQMNLE
jgi:tetratricopeptide (TPR) repeat protein